MNRPSHWILGFLAVLGGTLWCTGALQDYLSAQPVLEVRGDATRREPVRVQKQGDAPPPVVNSEVVGRVIDRLGFPVAAAHVRVAGEDGEPVMTDSEGRFRLTVSGAVHKRLRIEALGRHAPVEVKGSVDPIEVVLQDALPEGWQTAAATATAPQPAGLLFGEGFVKDAQGRHAAGVRVTVAETGASARTDENGRYTIPLGEGPCTLVAFDQHGGVATSKTDTPPQQMGRVPCPELRLQPGPTLRGVLRNTDGEPLVGAAFVVATGGIRRTEHTGPGGVFAVPGLVAGAAELIVLPHRGHQGVRLPLEIHGDVDLEDDVKVQRFRQEPVRLQVLDTAGTRQSWVHVVAEQIGGLTRAYGQADADGLVMLRGLGDVPTEFEVRDDPTLEPLAVAGYDEQQGRLLVAR